MEINGVTSAEPLDLKVGELLKEVQLDYNPTITTFVDNTVSTIKESIDKIPENLKIGKHVASGFIRDIGAENIEFVFKKPKSVKISGSYSIRSIAKPCTGVDVFITLPKECFHEKDYMDYRYHGKRCLYLCVLKKYLGSSSLIKNIEWSTFHNEGRKPVLIVYPVQEIAELPGFFIRLIPTAPSLFDMKKLKLTRNNVRLLKKEGNAFKATPKYNSSILEDMFMEENAEFVERTFNGWKELEEALILFKVWARHRRSIYVHDCLNGFLISVIMSYLGSNSGGNRINRSMKAMQIFRITLDFIATSKLWDKGLSLPFRGQCNISKEERRQYLQSFPVVILNSSAHFNLAFRGTKSGFVELRDEASLTLSCIEKCQDGGFEEIFMTKVDFPAKYDYCIRINLRGNNEVYSSGFCLDDECWRTYEEKVHSLLEQGLTDRAKLIRITWKSDCSEWRIKDGFSKFGSDPLLAGILVSSSDKSLRVVDVGPSAENKEEVLKFRKFWGEKSELRRFKDGTIAESTVWECGQWEKYLIIKKISDFVLLRHLSLSEENTVHVADQLDFCLQNGIGDPISFCGSILAAFEVLSKRLRNLEDIPLRVSSVQPLDSAFRFMSVFPPEPHPLASEKDVHTSQKHASTCIQPLEVMIQLEGSGNWPTDDVMIEKTKSAFLLKIGESLQKNWGMMCTTTEEEVNVLMSGYAFCLRILHERGLSLVKKQVPNDQTKQISSIDKELFIRSQHSSMVNGLQGRFPIYAAVVRLAKRWIASHLFSALITEEAIELLVARIFLKPLPFYTPYSRITGFLRFLRLLSEYDWTFSPLVVDINSDFTLKDEKDVSDNFMLSRKSYEENAQNLEPAIFLATPYDKASEAWTRSSPNTSELKRIVAYARSSADYLTNLVLQEQIDNHNWERLFRTPLNNYDAVILLHRDRLPFPQRILYPSEMKQGKHVAQGDASKEFNPYMSLGGMRGNLEAMKTKLMINFDPVKCYVEDVKGEYQNRFKLWYDSVGGDAIGLTWEKPGSKKRGREEVDESGDVIDMLRDVGEIGKGLVRGVHFLKAPRLRN